MNALRQSPVSRQTRNLAVIVEIVKQHITRTLRNVADVVALAAAYCAAWALRFEGALTAELIGQALSLMPAVIITKYALTGVFGARRHSWQFIGLGDVLSVVRAMGMAAVALAIVRLLSPFLVGTLRAADYGIIPFGVIAIDFALSTLALVGMRTIRRMQMQSRETAALAHMVRDEDARQVLLIGAGRAGLMVARELSIRPDLGLRAIGFVDDSPQLQGQTIHGIPVVGTSGQLRRLVDDLQPDEAIITIASATGGEIRRIMEHCEQVGLPVKIIPGLHEIVGGEVNLSRIRPVAIQDLLRREPVELDVSEIRAVVAHEVVMVTGAGGSIGSELCRQLAKFSPRELVLVDRAEPALWAIHRDIETAFPDVDVFPAIADVGDRERMDRLLLQHRPSVVFHAAAHKHVPMMERNPGEAIKNNVFGTRTLADLAVERGVLRFVNISTDKAVNPTSVMGATKRVAERYVQHLAHTTGRSFVSVRFGNVLASAGSVVPIFQQQIAAGGPITVTHPDMRRYFMTIPEAAQLVLQAGAMGSGGEIFVLDMGDPVRIVDLAEDLIRLSGFAPYQDIEILFTGLRPGEKLFEELSLTEENADKTRHPKVWIGQHASPAWSTVDSDLDRLRSVAGTGAELDIERVVRDLVPEFRRESDFEESTVVPIPQRSEG